MIIIEQIKKLRDETQAPIADIREALEESKGDEGRAKKLLLEKQLSRAQKKSGREAGDGMIFSYVHLPAGRQGSGGKVGVLLEMRCETDFVARTAVFQNLGKELTLQIASMNPASVEKLLEQEYIREPEKKVADLVGAASGTLGEHVKIERFVRYDI